VVIDPWGTVLLDMGGAEPGLAVVDFDIGQVERVRAQIPSLMNERSYRMNFETS
jgi:predicted amidohydrolase